MSFFFFSSRRRHTRSLCDWSSDVCSSDLRRGNLPRPLRHHNEACSRIMNAAQGIEDESSGKQLPTILVVDDVVLARMVAASQLRHHGFTVIEVSSADEAMRILEAPVKVDLVFAHVNLEGSSL